jgi:hypothetical protein
MSLFVDEKFINNISHQLRNFHKKKNYLWNFSCPVCGDSKKNKLKARAYVFRVKDGLVFKCHNCGEVLSFSDFVKSIDPALYKEYVYESYLEKGEAPPVEKPKKTFKKKATEHFVVKPTVLDGCPSIAVLDSDHPARAYIEGRLIPKKFYNELYWTDDFPALVRRLDPTQTLVKKEGRIVIPFFDRHGNLLAIQGRSLEPDAMIRYITIKAFESAPRIYGMNRLAKSTSGKRIYVTEGPFDSLFLPNCIAMAGGDIPPEFPTENTLIIYDNEPTKPETVEKIRKAIDRNYRVCIWPEKLPYKDINLMVMNGYNEAKIRDIVDSNSYIGLEARLKLQHWSNPKGNRKDGTTQSINERYNHQL